MFSDDNFPTLNTVSLGSLPVFLSWWRGMDLHTPREKELDNKKQEGAKRRGRLKTMIGDIGL